MKHFIFIISYCLLMSATHIFVLANPDVSICDNIVDIKLIPFKGEYVDDIAYNELVQKGYQVIPCLIEKIVDTSKMSDPRKAPRYENITVGDVSLFVLLDITGEDLVTVLPDNIRDEFKRDGVYAYFRFVENPEHRRMLQQRVRELLQVDVK